MLLNTILESKSNNTSTRILCIGKHLLQSIRSWSVHPFSLASFISLSYSMACSPCYRCIRIHDIISHNHTMQCACTHIHSSRKAVVCSLCIWGDYTHVTREWSNMCKHKFLFGSINFNSIPLSPEMYLTRFGQVVRRDHRHPSDCIRQATRCFFFSLFNPFFFSVDSRNRMEGNGVESTISHAYTISGEGVWIEGFIIVLE